MTKSLETGPESNQTRKDPNMKGSIGKSGTTYIVRYPRGDRGKGRLQVRRGTLVEAEQLLNAMRYHDDIGCFDPLDYESPRSLALNEQGKRWLREWVPENVKVKTQRQYELYIYRAIEFFGSKNIRTFKTKDIKRFLESQKHMKNKSKSTLAATLKSFFRWARQEDLIRGTDVPEFPTLTYKLGTRKTVTKETQAAIIEELHRQTYEYNPRIWLGVKWLATYVCMRPGDLRRIRECDIDRRNRVVYVRDPKATEPYEVPLTTQDVETLLRIAPGAPGEHFFRHSDGRPFGEGYLYECWKKACKALGIKDVDLYGGTRHSSVKALRHTHTPEQIRWATMHRTNEAFERYFSMDPEDLRQMYETNQHLARLNVSDARSTVDISRGRRRG